MTLPLLDLAATPPNELLAALQQHGAVLIHDPNVPAARCDQALADVAAFFALPSHDKHALAIERSPHFRGYSELHNERDWREQIHFGRELPAVARTEPCWRLQGQNLWPADAAWRARMLAYLQLLEEVGRRLLTRIAEALATDAAAWLGNEPYMLMKCIGYHPQPATTARRQGVAAHVDFSLVTLTLQDDVGGLEVRDPSGTWVPVPTARGAWLVNTGELLQFVTGNRLLANPHRVVNPSRQRSRYSIPVFVNPSLATTLVRTLPPIPAPPVDAIGQDHVHAVLDGTVLDSSSPPAVLPYGPAEWRRKGENVWCTACHKP